MKPKKQYRTVSYYIFADMLFRTHSIKFQNADNWQNLLFYLQWYWINFEDTKHRKQNLSSIEYIRMFGCFDLFDYYDCNAVYSL